MDKKRNSAVLVGIYPQGEEEACLSSIEELCNRVIWLHQGEIKMEGASKEVIAEYRKTINKA